MIDIALILYTAAIFLLAVRTLTVAHIPDYIILLIGCIAIVIASYGNLKK